MPSRVPGLYRTLARARTRLSKLKTIVRNHARLLFYFVDNREISSIREAARGQEATMEMTSVAGAGAGAAAATAGGGGAGGSPVLDMTLSEALQKWVSKHPDKVCVCVCVIM